jgi:hypothetical protein
MKSLDEIAQLLSNSRGYRSILDESTYIWMNKCTFIYNLDEGGSYTPFSTCTMGLIGSGATSFRSESLLLDSGFFLDRGFLTLLSGWFLVELRVATLLTTLSLRLSNSTPERHFSGFSIPAE